MIREFRTADTKRVMQIWIGGNRDAHPFIPKDYWESKYSMVEKQLLQAELFIYETENETDGGIQGFIGIMDSYIAGIFVDQAYRSLGIGKQLLDHVKQRYRRLLLNVYQRNERAAAFYFREGFRILSEGLDEATGAADYTMQWKRVWTEGRGP